MNFLQPSPGPLLCWGRLAGSQGPGGGGCSGLELPRAQYPVEGSSHLQQDWSFQRRDGEATHSEVLVPGGWHRLALLICVATQMGPVFRFQHLQPVWVGM